MKIACVGDAYITGEMMRNGLRPFLGEDDSLEAFFFGDPDQSVMRDLVKIIEAGRREDVPVPEGLCDAVADAVAKAKILNTAFTLLNDSVHLRKEYMKGTRKF
mgnify:CR=1 FL=1